jgi:hypothetical protein
MQRPLCDKIAAVNTPRINVLLVVVVVVVAFLLAVPGRTTTARCDQRIRRARVDCDLARVPDRVVSSF